MTTTVSGGGGGGYPGVTSDGFNGLTLVGGISGGRRTDTPTPTYFAFRGSVEMDDAVGNGPDGDSVLFILQSEPQQVGAGMQAAVEVRRAGDVTLEDYVRPALFINDLSESLQPSFQVMRGATPLIELTSAKSITGALSTVTDAAAKAVLTSIIATITGIKLATNNTT